MNVCVILSLCILCVCWSPVPNLVLGSEPQSNGCSKVLLAQSQTLQHMRHQSGNIAERTAKHAQDHLAAENVPLWKADTPKNLRHVAKMLNWVSTNFPSELVSP